MNDLAATTPRRPSPAPAPLPSAAAGLPEAEAILAQAGSENFPVAPWILGPRLGADLMALYGFARLVDDVGDEVAGDRLALLDQVEAELGDPHHPLMVALARTRTRNRLATAPFARLIEANRVDQRVSRYEDLDALWGYCMLSAAPVGEIVLALLGQSDPERIALSDCVCNALQIIEHLQDMAEDRDRGRVYIADRDRATAYATQLLGAGPPLVRRLRGRARLAVAGFLAGGRIALAELSGPRLSRARRVHVYARALAGR